MWSPITDTQQGPLLRFLDAALEQSFQQQKAQHPSKVSAWFGLQIGRGSLPCSGSGCMCNAVCNTVPSAPLQSNLAAASLGCRVTDAVAHITQAPPLFTSALHSTSRPAAG